MPYAITMDSLSESVNNDGRVFTHGPLISHCENDPSHKPGCAFITETYLADILFLHSVAECKVVSARLAKISIL